MTEAEITPSEAMAADPVARSVYLGVADEQEAIVWHNVFGDPEVIAEIDRLVGVYRAAASSDDPADMLRAKAADATLRATFERAARYATN